MSVNLSARLRRKRNIWNAQTEYERRNAETHEARNHRWHQTQHALETQLLRRVNLKRKTLPFMNARYWNAETLKRYVQIAIRNVQIGSSTLFHGDHPTSPTTQHTPTTPAPKFLKRWKSTLDRLKHKPKNAEMLKASNAKRRNAETQERKTQNAETQ